METSQEEALRFLDIIRHLSDVRLQDLSQDTTEAQWYEPWNYILTRVVSRISKDLTVAPQYRLARIHMAEDNNNKDQELADDLSMVANTSLIDLEEPEEKYLLVKRVQIPDFVIFYSMLGAALRTLPVIIEIKPPIPHAQFQSNEMDAIVFHTQNMIRQTLQQARHAFACYSEMAGIDILCVVGEYWHHYYVDRSQEGVLPIMHDDHELSGAEMVHKLSRTKMIKPQKVYSKDKKTYSSEFKNLWSVVAKRLGIEEPIRWD